MNGELRHCLPNESEHCAECRANGQDDRCLVWTANDEKEVEVSLCPEFPNVDSPETVKKLGEIFTVIAQEKTRICTENNCHHLDICREKGTFCSAMTKMILDTFNKKQIELLRMVSTLFGDDDGPDLSQLFG